MVKKICNRLQWCYPNELVSDDRWRELVLRTEAEWETNTQQTEGGHLCEARVRATTDYDVEDALVRRAYDPIVLKGFTVDGSWFILGSVLCPVLVEYDRSEEATNFEFSCKYPL